MKRLNRQALVLATTGVLFFTGVLGCADKSHSPGDPSIEKPAPLTNAISEQNINHLKIFLKINLVKQWLANANQPALILFGREFKNPFFTANIANCHSKSTSWYSQLNALWLRFSTEIQDSTMASNCQVEGYSRLEYSAKSELHRKFYRIPAVVRFKLNNSYTTPSIFLKELHFVGESNIEVEHFSGRSKLAQIREEFVGTTRDDKQTSLVEMLSDTQMKWRTDQSSESDTKRFWRLSTNNVVTNIREEIIIDHSQNTKTTSTIFVNGMPVDKNLLEEISTSL